jgi:hypothetical protein
VNPGPLDPQAPPRREALCGSLGFAWSGHDSRSPVDGPCVGSLGGPFESFVTDAARSSCRRYPRYPSEMTTTGSIKSQLRQLARSHSDDDTGEVARLAAELADKIEDLQMHVGALIEAVEERSGPL